MCLSLEHQNPSETSEKWVILIVLQCRYTFFSQETEGSRDFFTRHFVPRLPFGRRAVRQRGYGLRLLIFKMANNKVDLGQIKSPKSEEIVYSRFIKIPLG